MDKFMRDRAEELGTNIINGLVTDIDIGTDPDKLGPYTITYSDYLRSLSTFFNDAVVS